MRSAIKRRFTGCQALLAFTVLLTGLPVHAQGSAVIEGYVRDRHGKLLTNVTLVLKGGSGIQVDRVQTNQEGQYSFFQIGAGTYFITIEWKGVPGESRRVEFAPNESGGHRREDFTIEDLEPAAALSGPSEPIFLQQVPAEAQLAYQKGLDHLKNNRRDDALAAFELAISKFPTYFEALRSAGMEHLQRADAAKAGPAFQRAVAVNKNSASARFGLGWAFYQAEQLEHAARELSESAKLNPRLAETHWYLGMTQLERKQWAEAEQAFLDFKKLNPRSGRPMLHLYLTSVYDALGRPADAVQSLETYLREVPEKDRTQKLKDLLAQLKRKAR